MTLPSTAKGPREIRKIYGASLTHLRKVKARRSLTGRSGRLNADGSLPDSTSYQLQAVLDVLADCSIMATSPHTTISNRTIARGLDFAFHTLQRSLNRSQAVGYHATRDPTTRLVTARWVFEMTSEMRAHGWFAPRGSLGLLPTAKTTAAIRHHLSESAPVLSQRLGELIAMETDTLARWLDGDAPSAQEVVLQIFLEESVVPRIQSWSEHVAKNILGRDIFSRSTLDSLLASVHERNGLLDRVVANEANCQGMTV